MEEYGGNDMVKFVNSKANASAEEVMENVNRYIALGADEIEELGDAILAMHMDLTDIIAGMNASYQLTAYMPIESNSGVKRFVKKCIRKLVGWYMDLVLQQQQEFNAKVTQAANIESDLIHAMIKQMVLYKEENQKMKMQLMQPEKKNEK